MPIDRATIFRGPGHIVFDGATIISAEDIEVTLINEYRGVDSSGYGTIDQRIASRRVEVSCTPLQWNSLAVLFPYASLQIGQSIFGGTDKPLTVLPREGTATGITVAAAAITQLPRLNLRMDAPMLGQMRWTGILANNADPAVLANYYGTAVVTALPDVTLAQVRNAIFSGAWGSITGFGAVTGWEGWEVEFALGLEEVRADGHGVVDMRLASFEATARCQPIGPTVAQVQGALAGAPGSRPSSVANLTLTGGSTTVVLHNCYVRQATQRYGNQTNRLGALEWSTIRTQATNALGALFTIA